MTPDEEYEYRRQQRHARLVAKRKRERRNRMIARLVIILVIIVVGLLVVNHFVPLKSLGHSQNQETTVRPEKPNKKDQTPVTELSAEEESPVDESTETPDATTAGKQYSFTATDATQQILSNEVVSHYCLLVNCDDGTITAEYKGDEKIYPASMTKVLTLLVAAEHITNPDQLNDTVTMPEEIGDFVFKNDCSVVGFSNGETVPVKDLFYGTILPSGADAALLLANYTAGSHEAFVDLMNQKLVDLGISDTAHFTNCIGIFDENNYCTPVDMAIILNAAMDNDICREALSAHTYTTTSTTEHPEGILISNWFLRRIEDKDCGGTVVGAKTGFVNESGNCAASYFTANDGTNYICVTGASTSSWRAIYDHVAIYNIYAVGNTGYTKGGASAAPAEETSTDSAEAVD